MTTIWLHFFSRLKIVAKSLYKVRMEYLYLPYTQQKSTNEKQQLITFSPFFFKIFATNAKITYIWHQESETWVLAIGGFLKATSNKFFSFIRTVFTYLLKKHSALYDQESKWKLPDKNKKTLKYNPYKALCQVRCFLEYTSYLIKIYY